MNTTQWINSTKKEKYNKNRALSVLTVTKINLG